MNRTLDGIAFDSPPTAGQVMALAQQHHQKLIDAIARDVHLGQYNLAQRKEVYDFTRALNEEQRDQFYKVYNNELVRLADEERLHADHTETGVNRGVIFAVLAIIALVLYFTIVPNVIR